MSIRLRFTLLYNAILALTLALFGISLYAIQAKTTYDALQSDLTHSADGLVEPVMKAVTASALGGSIQPDPRPPKPFDALSGGQDLHSLPEREIVRVLDASGSLVASPFGNASDALPLSAAGLKAVQSQADAWETAGYQGQGLLIYNRPLVVNGKVAYILQVARPLAERERSLHSLATIFIIASLLTILAAFGIGWLLAGLTLQPIHRLTHTAQKIGEERDFTRRVTYTGPQDEVGQLATTFNAMLSRLQDAYQQVAHALELQRNFVADVSHELRTPLTTLRGNLGLLRRQPPILPDERDDILSDMNEESDRLIRLVNDLLVLARADAGRSLAKENVEILPLLDEICRQARLLEPERSIALQAEPLAIIGDRDALKQALLVGVDNALKHSTGDVVVSARRQENGVEIRVRDFGEGIPPEVLSHIFDRFYRGDPVSGAPGFGLGLAIAKALVEGQGGAIRMESLPGQGSTLMMTFAPGGAAPAG